MFGLGVAARFAQFGRAGTVAGAGARAGARAGMFRAQMPRTGMRFASSGRKRMTMKELAKQYGWTATGVYCLLMAIDLPLSYLLVHEIGTDTFADYEVKLRDLVGYPAKKEDTYIGKAAKNEKSKFFAEFGVAYLIHKILIVVRVPLTVAMTPWVSRQLARWGFNVKGIMPSVDKNKLANQYVHARNKVAAAAGMGAAAAAGNAARTAVKEGKIPEGTASKIVSESGAKAAEQAKRSAPDVKDAGKDVAGEAAAATKASATDAVDEATAKAKSAAEDVADSASDAAESASDAAAAARQRFGTPSDKRKRWLSWFFG